VIGDTSDEAIKTQYLVDRPDPGREALYRSVAAIPILVNSGNEVWGVVTATTNRPNVFVRDKENIKVQNVEMIRDIARVAALLAGLCLPPPHQETVAKSRKK
jgi:GAF domain-containing protein